MLRKAGLLISVVAFFAALIVFGIRSFTTNNYPAPSEAYYLNDFADVFSPTFENYFIGEAETLYQTSKNIEQVGGAQIVFATFLLEDGQTPANFNKTTIFREWKIGNNNMGLLALFLFEKVNDEPYANYDLVEFQIEATDKMLIYLTVSKQLSIYSKTLLHYLPDEQLTNPYDYDLEIGSASMMNEFLNALYDEVYDMPEQVFPQDEFDSAFHDYWFEDESPSQYNANESMNIFDYFFSPYGTLYDRIIFGSLSVIFIIVSGGAGILKGKGGFSAGGGLFRHR
ncbi:MAG: hypothetical protein PHV19_04680 [Bacilli bacterium]|jgi:hypothetical protein|nr:hypothetical protein [Bacilli bacterium]